MTITEEQYQQLLHLLANKVSHQLRQPVCSLIGLMNLIRTKGLSAIECEEILHHMDICINRLDDVTRQMGAMIHEREKWGEGPAAGIS